MKKFFSKKINIIVSAIILCIVIAVAVVTVSGDTLKYNPNNATATNLQTKSAMQDYINTVKSQNAKLSADLDDVITTITFSKAMSANDLKQYIDSYDIEIVQLQARGFDTSGNRVTFFSRTDKGLDETFRILEQQAQSAGADFAGAIGMYALTSSDKVTAIQNDANTFLVDTSTDEQYRKSTTTILGTKKDTTISDDKVERVFSHSVAWDAEELGLVDYK